MHNFWPSTSYQTLQVNQDNQLIVTDDFLRMYLSRPELSLIPQSCLKERQIHEELVINPRQEVSEEMLQQIQDKDVLANYQIWFRYRTKLLEARSLESFYMGLFKGDGVDVPPLFINQLVQIFMCHLLGRQPKGMDGRVGEIFFRTQKISVLEDGIVMAADDETVNRNAQTEGFDNIIDLLNKPSFLTRKLDLDVLNEDNEEIYWTRDEDFDFAIPLNIGQKPIQNFCDILERWINHFLGVEVKITPLQAISDPQWIWHVGLDAAATEILNALYNKEFLEPSNLSRIICLFRLDFLDIRDIRPEMVGKPVYLAIAKNENHELKLKPQNLLFNLPLAKAS